MNPQLFGELGLSWTELWLVILTAVVIYVTLIALSRLFGQRHLATTSSYDVAFVFAIGSVAGRAILVRTSLLAAVVGLATMFGLHALATRLHHHVPVAHRLMENRAIVLVAQGRVLNDNLERAHTSAVELYEAMRLAGHGSLENVRAAVLERNGTISFVGDRQPLDAALFHDVIGKESLTASDSTDDR